MESAYSFIKITLLGLILGVLIVLLLQINYLADNIRITSRQPDVQQDKEYRQGGMLKDYKSDPPVYRVPNTPKYRI
jgi:hypothetical protein